ncbi:hypothetical protein DPMN_044651 [Dreissena polymorpha]|uniref:Uncharacterized protein n=1 Tax=Dreissena polymorpha TaxID=45954 RepID=A0A9D4D2N3_DREPO|nr:hypothetical protein DPMN_044651 [Dreissena polymorpha]
MDMSRNGYEPRSVKMGFSSLGINTTYERREAFHALMRKLMSIPFLPGTHIPRAFSRLAERATTMETGAVFDYIKSTWLEIAVWVPEEWSVYRQTVRMNNDTEVKLLSSQRLDVPTNEE